MTTDTLRAAIPLFPKCHVAVIGFRWDSDAQQHIPQLLVEFEPVAAGLPNTEQGWRDRDTLAAMLSPPIAAPQAAPAVPHQWTEAEAIDAAHAAGFAGTCWTMGPYELVHLLNMLAARPQAGQAGQAGQGERG